MSILLSAVVLLSGLSPVEASYCNPPSNIGSDFQRKMELENYQRCISDQQQEILQEQQRQRQLLQQQQNYWN